MSIRRFIIVTGQLVYDFFRLLRPKTIFVHAFISREGIKYGHYNWGDDINIWMLEEISDIKVLIVNRSRLFPLFAKRAYCCIGSILGMCREKRLVVWGSGFISEDSKMKVTPEKVYSVRGPLSRNKLLEQGISCPAVYGDPALLISRYYRPAGEKRYKFGIIPHYIDEDSTILQAMKDRDDVCIISMSDYRHWHDIPDAVCSCEKILSSSLHGLIVSDSYGIPNVWVRISDIIAGGDFKFLDYFQSVHRDVQHPKSIGRVQDFDSIMDDTSLFDCAKSIDFDAIYNACPFKKHLHGFIQ